MKLCSANVNLWLESYNHDNKVLCPRTQQYEIELYFPLLLMIMFITVVNSGRWQHELNSAL